MYRVYFIGSRGQGFIYIAAGSKEEAKAAAASELKGETILTAEKIQPAEGGSDLQEITRHL